MKLLLYDYTGEEQKCFILPTSCNIHHQSCGDLYAEITCPAADYYKGDIKLGDLVCLPYPCDKEEFGNLFRITNLSTEEDSLTIKAWHRTYDFAHSICTRWNASEITLSAYVTMLNSVIDICNKVDAGETLTTAEQAIYAVKRIENTHGLRFAYFCHDEEDLRYSTRHSCGINAMSGNSILQHLNVTYGPNVIRDGNNLVLTYGSESDYFRTVYGLPAFSPIYKANVNVVGYTTENSIDGYVTSIAACSTFDTSLNSDDKAEVFCGYVTRTGINSAIAMRYMSVVNYSAEIDKADYTSYEAYKTAVINDVLAQAQAEVNSYSWEGQNVTVEAIATNDYLFGGEISLCADSRTHTDYQLAVESYDYDAVRKRYENIQMGRVTASLSDLNSGASVSSSSTGSAGGGLSIAQVLETLKTQYIQVDGLHSTASSVIDGRITANDLTVKNSTAMLNKGFIAAGDSQAQKTLLVGNGSPATQSLKVYDARNGVTYSTLQNKGAGYVVLPWGLVLMWGRVTVSLSNGSGTIDLPVKVNTLLNATANASNSSDVWVNIANPASSISDAHPNGYMTVKCYSVADGEINYPSGNYSIMYQAIGY